MDIEQICIELTKDHLNNLYAILGCLLTSKITEWSYNCELKPKLNDTTKWTHSATHSVPISTIQWKKQQNKQFLKKPKSTNVTKNHTNFFWVEKRNIFLAASNWRIDRYISISCTRYVQCIFRHRLDLFLFFVLCVFMFFHNDYNVHYVISRISKPFNVVFSDSYWSK